MAATTASESVPRGRRVLVAVVLAAAGVLHLPHAVHYLGEALWMAVVAFLFVIAALTVAVLLVRDGQPSTLLAVALLGMLGVAMFLLTRLVPLPGLDDELGSWIRPWALAAFIIDALVVRLAVLTLRITAGSPTRGAR